MSSNFDFLNETEPELNELATGAEQLVHESPTTALRELRTFGEVLIQRVLDRTSTQAGASTQHDRLVVLEENGTLPKDVATALHEIRMRGNDASHDNTGTRQRAQRQLYNAWVAAVWLQNEHHPGMSTPTEFSRPKVSTQNMEGDSQVRVKSEVEALERRLEAVEGRQKNSSEVKELKARIEELEAEKRSNPRSLQKRDSTVMSRIHRVGRRGKRTVMNGLRAAVRAGGAVVRGIYSVIRFIGRTVRRAVKITALLALVGAFLMYLPSVYSASLKFLPKDTVHSLPASEAVKDAHAKVIPSRVRTRVEEAVTVGWAFLEKEGTSMLRSLRQDLSVNLREEEGDNVPRKE